MAADVRCANGDVEALLPPRLARDRAKLAGRACTNPEPTVYREFMLREQDEPNVGEPIAAQQ